MGMGSISAVIRVATRILLVATWYFLAGKIGLGMAFVHPSVTSVWAPSGIALTAFLLYGRGIWPGVFLGAFLVNVTTAGSAVTSLAIATGNTLEGMCAAYLIVRYSEGMQVFSRTKNIFAFLILAALCSPLISATIGVSSLALAGYADWGRYSALWLTWWLGSGVGIIVVTPLLLLWSLKLPWNFQVQHLIEALALLGLLIVMGQAVFGNWFSLGFMVYPVAYLCTPLLVWTAFRFDQREITTLNFLLCVISVAGTMRGHGPFMRPTWHESILLLQVFLTITTITCLVVSALVSERKVLVTKLQDMLAQVRTLTGLLPICAWCKKVRDDKGYWREVEVYIRDHSDMDISHGICPDCLITYKSEVLGRRRKVAKDEAEEL